MVNQFVQYPITIQKAINGYVVYKANASIDDPRYVFATMADLSYWLGLNEEKAVVV